jgi:hypothetical protein
MNEAQRQSYAGVLRFKTRQELLAELKAVEAAIKQKSGGVVGDYYFKRLALQQALQRG